MMPSRFLGLLVAAWLVQGCAASRVAYHPNPGMPGAAGGQARVAVVRFDCLAPPDKAPNIAGAMMLPLYLYTQKIISSEPWFYTQTEGNTDAPLRSSLKRMEACLAEDLAASGMFRSSEHKTWEELYIDRERIDFVVTGRLERDVKVITYFTAGIPFLSTIVFTFLPLPTNFASRSMVLHVQVANPRQPLEPLFEKTYAVSRGGVGLFGMLGGLALDLHTNEDTPELYREAFAALRADLARELGAGGKLSAALASTRNQAAR